MSWHEIEVRPHYSGQCLTQGCNFGFDAETAGAAEDVARDHINEGDHYAHEVYISVTTQVGRK